MRRWKGGGGSGRSGPAGPKSEPARHPAADRDRDRLQLLPGAGFPRVAAAPAALPDVRHLRQALGPGVRDRAGQALPRGIVRARSHRQAGHPPRLGRAVEEPAARAGSLPNVVCKLSGRRHRGRPPDWRRERCAPMSSTAGLLRLQAGDVRQRLDRLGADPRLSGVGGDPGRDTAGCERRRTAQPLSRHGKPDYRLDIAD